MRVHVRYHQLESRVVLSPERKERKKRTEQIRRIAEFLERMQTRAEKLVARLGRDKAWGLYKEHYREAYVLGCVADLETMLTHVVGRKMISPRAVKFGVRYHATGVRIGKVDPKDESDLPPA